MISSDILIMTFELKDKILNSEEYKNLKEKENKMLNNSECMILLSEFEKIKEEYNQAKRFEKYGSNVAAIQKMLSDMKYKVDNNKYVKEYNEAYKIMKRKLKEIENIIFKDIIKEKKQILLED